MLFKTDVHEPKRNRRLFHKLKSFDVLSRVGEGWVGGVEEMAYSTSFLGHWLNLLVWYLVI
jgi:hypothetical protein